MSLSRPAGRKRPVTIAIAGAAAAALALTTVTPASAKPPATKTDQGGLYLVQMKGSPLATYTGGVLNIPGTKAAEGKKLDKRAWNYQSYRQYLRDRRANVQRAAGVPAQKTVAEYDTVFNGFAAKLTAAEATRLRNLPEVAEVYLNRVHTVQTVSTPKFLGLEGAGGVWQKQFGDPARAGEGVIIGVVDTGYWPESASFAPLPEPRPDQAIIDQKWGTGEAAAEKCDVGTELPVPCNNKVIGARWYNIGKLGDQLPEEFHSARDLNGHGTHTASTAAGNHGVPAVVNGAQIGMASGIAPAARLAIYKALWETPGGGSGTTVDILAAINDAVSDGVDVLNYSVGDANDAIDPIDRAFLDAAAAGVFVSAAAGNEGQGGASTVDNAGPWVTTVAASTHDRDFSRTVTLGNGATYTGAGVGPALPSAPLIDAATAGAPGKPVADASLCKAGALDNAKVTGKIVLCQRGEVALVEKSETVKGAGGVGMVLFNAVPGTLNALFHFVPTIHVNHTDGPAIKSYINATPNATAALSEGKLIKAQAPAMAAFSSIGPSKSSRGDVLKPDITAPGVDVLAAVSPGPDGNAFNTLSGTSMATPHIAGLGALVRSKNPTWSPMAIKSALMTTSGQLDNAGKPIKRGAGDATPFDFGAGHVSPAGAFDPGLVYDSQPVDWLRYSCGIGIDFKVGPHPGEDLCPIIGSIDPSDLNYPSIAVGDLAGKQTVTRTVTNVTNRSSIYVSKVQAPAGFSVTVTPQTLVVPPRGTATFKVEIARTTAALNAWAFGSLSWLDSRGHGVRSPISVRASVLATPPDSTFSGASGSRDLALHASYKGPLTAKAIGLAAGAVTTTRLVGWSTGFSSAEPKESEFAKKVRVTVPKETRDARVATFGADHARDSSLELYAYDATGTLVGASNDGSADQRVALPGPGTYDVFVVQSFLPDGDTEQDVKLNLFALGSATVGDLKVTPASQQVTVGATPKVAASWTGLTPGKRYLGRIEFGNGSAAIGSTLIWIVA